MNTTKISATLLTSPERSVILPQTQVQPISSYMWSFLSSFVFPTLSTTTVPVSGVPSRCTSMRWVKSITFLMQLLAMCSCLFFSSHWALPGADSIHQCGRKLTQQISVFQPRQWVEWPSEHWIWCKGGCKSTHSRWQQAVVRAASFPTDALSSLPPFFKTSDHLFSLSYLCLDKTSENQRLTCLVRTPVS